MTVMPARGRQRSSVLPLFDKFFRPADCSTHRGHLPRRPQRSVRTGNRTRSTTFRRSRCRQGVRILEVGCGNGTLLDEVRRRGLVGTGLRSRRAGQLCGQRSSSGLPSWRVNRSAGSTRDCQRRVEHFVRVSNAAAGKAEKSTPDVSHPPRGDRPEVEHPADGHTTTHSARCPTRETACVPACVPPFSDDFHYSLLIRASGDSIPPMGSWRCIPAVSSGC